jgi:hypothetical protein
MCVALLPDLARCVTAMADAGAWGCSMRVSEGVWVYDVVCRCGSLVPRGVGGGHDHACVAFPAPPYP